MTGRKEGKYEKKNGIGIVGGCYDGGIGRMWQQWWKYR